MDKHMIISFVNGEIKLNVQVLKKFIKVLKNSSDDCPVAIISVNGPSKSGRSFCTNLIIKYLENKLSDMWLSQFSSKALKSTKSLDGFAFGNVKNSKNFVPHKASSGIYIWKDAHRLNNYNQNILVCVLHPHYGDTSYADKHAAQSLDYLLNLLSSRLVLINCKPNKETNSNPLTSFSVPNYIYQNAVFLIRTQDTPHITSCTSEDLVVEGGNLGYEQIKGCSVAFIKECDQEEPWYNTQGKLALPEEVHLQLDNAIKHIVNRKTLLKEDNTVTLYGLENHVQLCVTRANQFLNRCRKNAPISHITVSVKGSSQNALAETSCTEHHGADSQECIQTDSDNSKNEGTIQFMEKANGENHDYPTGDNETELTKKVLKCTEDKSRADTEDSRRLAEEREKSAEETLRKATEEVEEKNRKLEEERLRLAAEAATLLKEEAKIAAEAERHLEEKAYIAEEDNIRRFVDEIIVEVDKRLVYRIEQWLQQLEFSNIGYCRNIYAISVEEILKESNNSKVAIMEISIKKHLDESFGRRNQELENVFDGIHNFHLNVSKHMALHICFPESQITQELKSIYTSFHDGDDFVAKCVKRGCETLCTVYLNHNKRIAEYEYMLLTQWYDEVVPAYQVKVNKYVSDQPFPPKSFFNLHSLIVETIILCLKETASFNVNCNFGVSFIHSKIEKGILNRLQLEYATYKTANLDKLKKVSAAVIVVINKYKIQYCTEMEKLLQLSPGGIPITTIQSQHATVENRVRELLRKEIYGMVGKNEPTFGYEETLKHHIANVWLTFKETNESKLKAPKNNFQVLASVSLPERNLSPIIFQLSLNEIKTHIYIEHQLKDFGVLPAAVCKTVDNIFACITSTELANNIGDNFWRLSDCISGEPFGSCAAKTEIGGTAYTIRTELLLGFLFYTLKRNVEQQLRGNATECVITIPFWLTSSQRRQIKDSARVAGFQKSNIINENSAIALSFCQSSYEDGSHDIVVLSENSGCMDVTIYSYDKTLEAVKITGHCGDYETSVTTTSHYWQASLHDKVKDAYHQAQKQSDARLYKLKKLLVGTKPKKVVISTQKDEFKTVFSNVGVGISTYKAVSGTNEPMILRGAKNFSKIPSSKRNVSRDWLSSTVYRKIGFGYEETVHEKANCELFPSDSLMLFDRFNLHTEDAVFYQKDVVGNMSVIGILQIRPPPQFQRWLDLQLQVSCESIISLNNIQPVRGTVWTQDVLDDSHFALYISLFENFERIKLEIGERDKKTQQLIGQGNKLLRIAGSINFRSTLARDMALSQIQEALNLLNHPKITASDINKQLELFEKYETKFSQRN